MKAITKIDNGIIIRDKTLPVVDDHHVRIKVTLAGLCRTDIYAAQNKIDVQNGITLGHEFTGTIEKLGQKVTGFKLNQRVCVMPVMLQNNEYRMLGVDLDGAYANYITVPASQVYAIPDHLSIEEAAFMEPVAACLAVTRAPLDPKSRGLIYGNNRIAELTQRILNLYGFKHIDIGEHQHPSPSNKPYDFIIETVATADAFENMVHWVKSQGLILLKSRPSKSIPLPVHTIVKKDITVMGAYYGNVQESIDLLATGKLKVRDLFGPTYSLDEAIPILLGQHVVSEDKKIFFEP